MSHLARHFAILVAWTLGSLAAIAVEWTEQSPRPELRPAFSRDGGTLIITHDGREGLDGWYQHSFVVNGGDFMTNIDGHTNFTQSLHRLRFFNVATRNCMAHLN